MKLEQQVISRDLAKRLKELGVKQEALYWWNRETGNLYNYAQRKNTMWNETAWYAAFTVAELFNLMPMTYASVEQHSNDYRAGWKKAGQFGEEYGRAETPTEALGLMLAYLIENKLITV